jgi:hypothetical protein
MPHRCHPLLSTTTSDRLVPYVTYAPHRQGGWAFRSECMFGLRSIRPPRTHPAAGRGRCAMLCVRTATKNIAHVYTVPAPITCPSGKSRVRMYTKKKKKKSCVCVTRKPTQGTPLYTVHVTTRTEN